MYVHFRPHIDVRTFLYGHFLLQEKCMENTKEIIQSLIDCAVNEIISLIAKDLNS